MSFLPTTPQSLFNLFPSLGPPPLLASELEPHTYPICPFYSASLNYSSISMKRYHDQGSTEDEVFNWACLQFQVVSPWLSWQGLWQPDRYWSNSWGLTSDPQAHSRKRARLNLPWVFEASKPSPSDTPPPMRWHLLVLLKQSTNWNPDIHI